MFPDDFEVNLIAYYPFTDGVIKDFYNNHHLKNNSTASPAKDRNGIDNCAYEFNNINNTEFLISEENNILKEIDEITISAWVYRDTIPPPSPFNNNDYQSIISEGDSTRCPDLRGNISLSTYDCRRFVVSHKISVWENLLQDDCFDNINAVSRKWDHLTGVVKSDSIFIYVNGSLHSSDKNQANCLDGEPLDLPNTFLYVGLNFTGIIDDIMIFNKALTKKEINEIAGIDCCQ